MTTMTWDRRHTAMIAVEAKRSALHMLAREYDFIWPWCPSTGDVLYSEMRAVAREIAEICEREEVP